MENAFFNQVKDEVTAYGKSLSEIGKLRVIGIVSRVLGLFLLLLTIILCVLAILTFGAVAAINALSACMPVWAASLIIGGAYVLLILIAIIARRPLFINPFIKLLAKQVTTETELAHRIGELEHETEVQKVRMSCQVENVTREFNFYTALLSRMWNIFKALMKK